MENNNQETSNFFVDFVQDVFGSISKVLPTPVSETIDNVNVIIDIQQEIDQNGEVAAWKITAANISGVLASTPVVIVGEGLTFGAAISAIIAGGIPGMVGAAAIFYGGTMMTVEVSGRTYDTTRDSVLEALNSPGFLELEGNVDTYLKELRDSLNDVIGKTTGWNQQPFWLDEFLRAKNETLEGVTDVSEFLKDLMDDLLDDAQTISDFLQGALNDLSQSQVFVAPARRDPLSLDLDGDGIELVNVNESTAFFDLDVVDNGDGTYTSDGFKEQVGWVKGDDGILVLDKNNNGTIDNILELFGKENKTGTEELREYDLNGDGKIDNQDAIFNQLKVWQDVNQDGVSQSEELKTLSQLEIASINLNNLTTKNEVFATQGL